MAAKIIDLTETCPLCGERMCRRWDPRAKQYLQRGEDPGEYGCEPDHFVCLSCTGVRTEMTDEEIDVRLTEADTFDLANWFFPREMHETQRLLWITREAYRIGLRDGRHGR